MRRSFGQKHSLLISGEKRRGQADPLVTVEKYAGQCYKQLKSIGVSTKDKFLKPEEQWRLDPATRYKNFG